MCISIPGRVVRVHDTATRLAVVDVQGAEQVVNFTCLAENTVALESCVGTWVLMRSGIALAQVSVEEAQRALDVLALMQGLQGGHAPRGL